MNVTNISITLVSGNTSVIVTSLIKVTPISCDHLPNLLKDLNIKSQEINRFKGI